MNKPIDSEEDLEIFRRTVGDVEPLKSAVRTDSRAPQPDPRPRYTQADEKAVMHELLELPQDPAVMETGEELLYLRPGVQKRYLRRLRRGRYSIADSMDLHQMNEATASRALKEFIEMAAVKRLGCVRIIHGKGLRSRNGPKLKIMTRRLLSRHPLVLAFASCRPVDGGTGAVSILLRKL